MPVFVGAGTSSFAKGDGGIGFTRLNTTQEMPYLLFRDK